MQEALIIFVFLLSTLCEQLADPFIGYRVRGAEVVTDDNLNRVAFTNDDGKLAIWECNANWEWTGGGVIDLDSEEGLAWETLFGQDFHADPDVEETPKVEYVYAQTGIDLISYVPGETGSKTEPWEIGYSGTITGAGHVATVTVKTIQTSPEIPVYGYKSVYRSNVTLSNGGVNWRVGDTTTVTMNGKEYTITVTSESFGYSYVADSTVTYTTAATVSDGALDVGQIVGGLVTQINSLTDYKATPIGSTIYIENTANKDFNLQTRGGTANNALTGIKGSVNDISVLPTQCVERVVLKVMNTLDSDADDYYVSFKPSAGDIPGQGAWEETIKPGIATDLNPATMPISMIRQADGTFVVRPLSTTFNDVLSYASREVGDEDTNPEPSFVGRAITGMFFYFNRLGFLSEDSIILSQPGDYFNFFIGSAIAVSDADPSDMTASSTRPAFLKAAIGTPKGLLLFAENSQFLMGSAEAAFGPATAKISELSNYAYSSDVPPLETGVSVLFSTEAKTFSKVYELAVDSIDNRPLVAENTKDCP